MDWYYVENDLRMGPISEAEFDNLAEVGRIKPDTLVWQPGMSDWIPLSQLEGPVASAESDGDAPAEKPAPSGPSEEYPPPEDEVSGEADSPRPGGVWTSGDESLAPAAEEPVYRDAPYIPNYLVQSIIATLCCCTPLGVVAVVYAAQVNGHLATGDFHKARDASDKAKLFFWLSLGLSLLGWAFTFFSQGGLRPFFPFFRFL